MHCKNKPWLWKIISFPFFFFCYRPTEKVWKQNNLSKLIKVCLYYALRISIANESKVIYFLPSDELPDTTNPKNVNLLAFLTIVSFTLGLLLLLPDIILHSWATIFMPYFMHGFSIFLIDSFIFSNITEISVLSIVYIYCLSSKLMIDFFFFFFFFDFFYDMSTCQGYFMSRG